MNHCCHSSMSDDHQKPQEHEEDQPEVKKRKTMAEQIHSAPEPNAECIFCCDEIISDNYVEYQSSEDGTWFPCIYCKACMMDSFIGKQFQAYLDNLKTVTCPKALENMLNEGPPIFLKDPKSFPGDGSSGGIVHALWFGSDNSVMSAKLSGAVEGDERQQLWDRLVAETMPRVLKLQADIEAGSSSGGGHAAAKNDNDS